MNSVQKFFGGLGGATRVVLLALAVVFVSASLARAATTISTNVQTDGTLSATGLSSLGALNVVGTASFGATATSTFNSTGSLTFAGTVTGAGVNFNGATIAPSSDGSTNSALAIGNIATAHTVAVTTGGGNQNFDPIQLNLDITGTGPGSRSTTNGIYQLITGDASNSTQLRMKNADWTVVANHNLLDAYNMQNEIDLNGGSTVSGQAASLSAAVQIAGSSAIGEAEGLYASVGGAGAYTGNNVVVGKFVYSNTGAAAKAGVEINVPNGSTAAAGLLFDGVTDGGAITNDIVLQHSAVINNATAGTISFGSANLTTTGHVIKSVASPVAAGSTQADGVALTADINNVTGANGTKGAVLPTAVAGMDIVVINQAGSALKLYGYADAQQINGTGGATAFSITATTEARCTAITTTNWECELLAR